MANQITLALTGSSFSIPAPVFAILSIALIWISINVTNCADGVDGLSGTLTIITIMTFYFANQILGHTGDFDYLSLLFVVCLLGYLWFNATPSKMLMGDAGSRAMGLFIAIAALKCHDPFLLYFSCTCAYHRWWSWSCKAYINQNSSCPYFKECAHTNPMILSARQRDGLTHRLFFVSLSFRSFCL